MQVLQLVGSNGFVAVVLVSDRVFGLGCSGDMERVKQNRMAIL